MRFARRPSIAPDAAAAAHAGGLLVLVDVRQPVELRAGSARGALHIPLTQLAGRLCELDPQRRVAFLCHSGARSARATAVARRAGYDAVSVRGGIVAWKRAGLPFAKP